MSDQSFTQMLSKSFGKASAATDAATLLASRTRIDARTVGYRADNPLNDTADIDASGPQIVEWMGMSPVAGTHKGQSDVWRLVMVKEEQNHHLAQVNEHERLIEFLYNSAAEPMPFDKAVERLAVWEQSRMMRGFAPVFGQTPPDLGRHYFRDVAMRRGLVASTTGKVIAVKDILPQQSGQFLKSDLEAMEKYRTGALGLDPLGELINAHDPIYVNNGTIEEDVQQFGEINLFDKMQTLTAILVEYARVKLDVIQEFYGNPKAASVRDDLLTRINDAPFFNDATMDRYNTIREAFTGPVFRLFHMVESDWSEPLDLTRRDMRVQMLANPDAQETYDFLTRKAVTPMDQKGLDALLTVCARTLIFFREMLEDSSQKDALEQKGIYRQADIDDLLNYLDLLEIKAMHTEVAQTAFALPGTQKYKEIRAQKDAFTRRVNNLKANLRESGQLSQAQEAQVDAFIKASAPIYMIERIAALPDKIGAAHSYISDRLLPKQIQLSLPLDYSQSGRKRIAAPTRQTRDTLRSGASTPKP